MHRLLFFMAAVLPAACARPDYAESRPDWLLVSAGPQPGYAVKLVVEKDPPLTLIAEDGSLCRMSKERYKATKEGDWIACLWNLPAPDRTDLAHAP
jgi:hypothetical protein